MDYSQLSDFEINKLVAQAKRYPLKSTQHFGDAGLSIVMLEHGYPSHFDPCRNPTDAWPIITENRIGIIPAPEVGKWRAAYREVGEDNTPHHFRQNDNPLRAAMIVFLMMQDAKHA